MPCLNIKHYQGELNIMKKIALFLAVVLFVPSLSFAAISDFDLQDGTSLNANSTAVSLSPNVGLNYASVDGTDYALTGANAKGAMCYGVESGNQGVYQMKVTNATTIGGNVTTAVDDNDPDADQYFGVGTWQPVGK